MISSTQSYATLKQVLSCPLKTPANVGQHWEGMKHGELVTMLHQAFKDRGMVPIETRYDLSRDGADLTASWQVRNYPSWYRDIQAGFGLVTSNARRKALHFYVGAVEEQTGTPIVTDVIEGWRYVRGVDKNQEVERVIEKWQESITDVGHRITQLKLEPIDKRDVALLLMTAGRRKLIPWSRVGLVDKTWTRNCDPTSWGLIRAFWKASSISPAQDQMNQMYLFTSIVSGGVRALMKEAV